MITLIEDYVKATEISSEHFITVKRLKGKTDIFGMDIILDVHAELMNLEKGQVYYFALAKNKNNHDMNFKKLFNEEEPMEEAFFAEFNYVMHGKVFDNKPIGKEKMNIRISFGGLLLEMIGPKTNLRELSVDTSVYLMMRNG